MSFFYGVIGLALILYFIFIKIFIIHEPQGIFKDLDILRILFYGELALIFTLGFILSAKAYFFKFKSKPKNKLFFWVLTAIKKIIYSFYKKPLMSLEEPVRKKFFRIMNKISRSTLFSMVTKLLRDTIGLQRFTLVIFFFYCLPKLIIIISLGIDVFILGRLHYFYQCGPLYMLPLLIEYFIYAFLQQLDYELLLLKKKVKTVKISTQEEIEIDYSIFTDVLLNPTDYALFLKPEYVAEFRISPEDIQKVTGDFVKFICTDLTENLYVIVAFERVKNRITTPLNIFLLLGYSLIWTFVFVVSLYIFIQGL